MHPTCLSVHASVLPICACIRPRYEAESEAYYATARLWDDGIIEPEQTRDVLSLALAAAANAPVPPSTHGVYRM